MTFSKRCVACAVALCLLLPTAPVRAHGGVAHATQSEAEVHEVSLAKLEQLVALLKNVLALMTLRQELLGKAEHVTPHLVAKEQVATTTPNHDEHDSHATSTVATTTPIATFAIEVEEHDGKTHVHARYVDKPEDMFFVDAAIENEAALVDAIARHTGLPRVVIQPALVYLR